jgi:hypothetical protein
MEMPITRPRTASWSTEPTLSGPTSAFKLGIEDTHKSNEGLNGLLILSAMSAAFDLLSGMTA